MNSLKKFLIFFFFILVTSLFSESNFSCSKGLLDLRNWNFSKISSLKLNGEWKFAKQHFLNYDELRTYSDFSYIEVPGNWDQQRSSSKVPKEGFGTYYLKVILPSNINSSDLALRLLSIGNSYNLSINGQRLVSCGKVADNIEDFIPTYNPQSVILPEGMSELDILIQVASFDYNHGGIWEYITLGLKEEILNTEKRNQFLEVFLIGSILIMGLYHFGLYFSLRKDRTPLYFAIFCFLLASRTAVTGELILKKIIPDLSWYLSVRIEFLSMFVAVAFFALFLKNAFKNSFNFNAIKFIVIISLLFSLTVIIFPVKIFSFLLPMFQQFVIGSLLYAFASLIKAVIKKEESAAVMLTGFIILFIVSINDILYSSQILDSNYLLPYGLFLFIIFQALVLIVSYTKAFKLSENQAMELEKSNKLIRKEIKFRRHAEKKYKDIFKNSAEGIFILSPDFKIKTANRSFFKIFKLHNREIKDFYFKTILEYIDNISPDINQIMSRIDSANENEIEISGLINNKIVTFNLIFNKVNSKKGKMLYYQCMVQDITRKKISEEKLQKERVKTAFAMGVTANHELNQPLTVISSRIQLLKRIILKSADNEKQINHITGIEKNITKMSAILSKYSDISDIKIDKYADSVDMIVFNNKEKRINE